MTNCNIFPMIVIIIVIFIALYFLSKNDIVAPNQEGFHNYPYNNWRYRNYPYFNRWYRYHHRVHPNNYYYV